MKPEERRRSIMDLLMEAGSASVEDMANRFGVSRMTIHRDLDDLEQAGLLRKVHGGASIESSPQFESDFRYRERIAQAEKSAIAARAAELVEPGQTVILDDSSTAGAMAPLLLDIRPLTVITNNLSAIVTLSGVPGVTLIALGGQFNKKFNGFFGIVTEEALKSLRADTAFLSTSAIEDARAFHQDQEVIQIKRQMLRSARRRYLLADREKFGRQALHFFTGLDAFDAVLTGGTVSPAAREALAEAGIALMTANTQTSEQAA
ncbi:DeoR/GlpR family DNA-binding transcription regulator [Shinella daejeonensis]|uniref:DeoR/GlpR family DNA-binding transcription regulator n=1 Tax=Shinella daejeonensis TaxID=659017 RepID=UPI0020C7F59A|nr:DeoR/GlpR family DNA-binding transcription regulator [Shinella daejeonensis]MCP8893868.1 DeoR/GlpR family DNA-binding transcription regulator [Shinella daejeonensis]